MPVWLTNLLGGGLIDKILSFIPNPEEKAKAQIEIQSALVTAAIDAEKEQRDINKVEAASGSLFVAGWRPAVGWLCVFILAYQIVLVRLLNWVVMLFNSHIPPMPVIQTDQIYTLLTALLGVNIIARTADKAIPGGVTRAISGVFKK